MDIRKNRDRRTRRAWTVVRDCPAFHFKRVSGFRLAQCYLIMQRGHPAWVSSFFRSNKSYLLTTGVSILTSLL